jgi:hypothetical protein
MAVQQVNNVRVCPQCGFSHLRPSRPHSKLEWVRSRWTRTSWFRCETCQWRGCLRDEWSPDAAFPDLKPLKLGRDLNFEWLQKRDEEAIVEMALSRRAEIGPVLRVWLDDSRPAPPGWLRLGTVTSVQRLLDANLVQELSLDHDLGWCPECVQQGEHLKHTDKRHCPHMATGYDLVRWMADHDVWPVLPPTVHSGNLEGGARMLGVIARYWRGDVQVDGAAVAERGVATAAASMVAVPAASEDGPGMATAATLTMCPLCHGPYLSRTHRRSNFERLRSLVTRRYPVRCVSCGWSRWVHDPILVRFSSVSDPADTGVDPRAIEAIQPGDEPQSLRK